jgi:methionyl-tRNA formyltransferase
MRFVFFGASALGHRCCEDVLAQGHDVVAIVSMREEFEISYAEEPVRNVNYASFEDLAAVHDIPLLYVERRVEDELLEQLRALEPDFALVVGWYYTIPRALRELFPSGVAGIHASLLPRFRGGAPLVWALIEGERETGVTLFHLEDEPDSGDVIGRRSFPITDTDTIATLLAKAEAASLDLLREAIPLLADGRAPREPQDETQATTYPQRSPADGEIDWRSSAAELDRFIRAQTRPYPGAWTVLHGKHVTIWDATIE